MLRSTLTGFILPLLLLFGSSSHNSAAQEKQKSTDSQTATVEKLIVATGSVSMEVDPDRFDNAGSATEKSKLEILHFAVAPDSFFTIIVTNNGLRGPLPGSMGLIPQNAANLPALLNASFRQLVLEKRQSNEAYDLVVRDGKSGFVFFNIAGHQDQDDAGTHSLSINDGALRISDEFARQLGRPGEAGVVAGKISVTASMSPIEIQTVVNGEVQSAVMPSLRNRAQAGALDAPDAVTSVPGPDVIVGDLQSLEQPAGSSGIDGSFVGLGVGTTSCNNGDQEFNWFAMPNNDHPVIPQNLYRMSGGAGNNDRFEQLGQSWLKHAFFAEQEEACGTCVPHPGGIFDSTHLGVGCSDPYSGNLNYTQSFLGSRAWVNPFTGFFPRGDSATPPVDHSGHAHTGTSHRITVAMSDLNTTLNVGATYFAEGQDVTPHEYAWCQAHAGQCNQYNNVSYRQFSVSSSNQTNFTFTSAGSTVRMQPGIKAWTGATINQIEPDPGVDGIGFVGCKVTGPNAGVWHYEYAVYNENLDRAIQSFSVPLGPGITVSNIGFHAPGQDPGFAADGTVGNLGFSSTAWTSGQTSSSLTWSSETFAQDPNANAIRWVRYNFRFDSTSPPQATNATLGFFKIGSPITVGIEGPTPGATPTPTPTPSPTATPTPTPAPINISGTISYCSNPSAVPVPNVTLNVTGDTTDSTMSDGSGNYTLSLASGGNYVVMPAKAAVTPGSAGINGVDVLAVQRHYLGVVLIPAGCRRDAADVTGGGVINGVDVLAIQRFFLGQTSGIANVGKYQFTPVSRTYTGIVSDQTAQDYDALVFGDVTSAFVH